MIADFDPGLMIAACILMSLAIMANELRGSGVAGWLMMASAGTAGFALAMTLKGSFA